MTTTKTKPFNDIDAWPFLTSPTRAPKSGEQDSFHFLLLER